jgi:hypothetical protein
LIAVAEPYCAKVLLPVVPAAVKYIVSEVMAIVRLFADMLMKLTAVPTGYATDAFEGMVNVRSLASVDG